MKQLSKKQLLKLCIIFPILVSLLSRLLTPRMDEVFRQLNKPPFVPAPWIFSVVWLILDILLGLSLYTLLTSDVTEQEKKQGIKLFLAVSFFLFFWPIIFFEYGLVFFSFVWILALNLLNVLMFYVFRSTAKICFTSDPVHYLVPVCGAVKPWIPDRQLKLCLPPDKYILGFRRQEGSNSYPSQSNSLISSGRSILFFTIWRII